jgi:hypothetical protein
VSLLVSPINVLLAIILLILLLVRIFGRTPSDAVRHWIAGSVGLTTVAVAIALPVRQLDGRVGPVHYG